MTRKVKEALDAGGVDIPFPTQTLQLERDTPDPEPQRATAS